MKIYASLLPTKAFWYVNLCLLLLLLSMLHCKRSASHSPHVSQGRNAIQSPPPRPNTLVAEIILRSPNTTLKSLQPISVFVPDRINTIFAETTELGRELTLEIDGQKPIYIAIFQRNNTFEFATLTSLRDSSKLADTLRQGSIGKAPKFERVSEALSSDDMVFQYSLSARSRIVAIHNQWLVTYSSLETFKQSAAYMESTLAQQKLPVEDVVIHVPQSSIREVELPFLRTHFGWNESNPNTSPNWLLGFTYVQVQSLLQFFYTAQELTITASIRDDALVAQAHLTFTNIETTTLPQWSSGQAPNVLDMPISSVAALSIYNNESQRMEITQALFKALTTTLSKALETSFQGTLKEWFTSFSKLRGQQTRIALLTDSNDQLGISMFVEATAPRELSSLFRTVVESTTLQPKVQKALEQQHMQTLLVQEKIVDQETNILSIKIQNLPSTYSQIPKNIDIIWWPSEKGIWIVAAASAREFVPKMLLTTTTNTLRARPELNTQLNAVREPTLGSLIVFPSRILPLIRKHKTQETDGNDPIYAILTRSETGLRFSIELSKPAFIKAARMMLRQAFGTP